MGSVRRAPRSNRWEARYRDPLGAQRTKTFDAKADAKAFLANVETSIARGTWRDPGRARAKFSRAAAEWLASNPGKRATTYARDATVIRTHLDPVLGDLPVNRIQPQQVQEVIDRMVERGLGPKTIRTDYGVLRAIWGEMLVSAAAAGRDRTNPCSRRAKSAALHLDVTPYAAFGTRVTWKPSASILAWSRFASMSGS